MSNDGELLARYAARGADAEEAFATLVQRHIDLVYSGALRRLRGDAHAATDISQQVFLALARRAARLDRGVVLPAWLFTTTRNLAVDFIRREHARRAREQEVAAMSDQSGDEPAVNWEQVSPWLDAAMDELRETDRAAVVLRFFSPRSFAEVGRALGVSEDAARMRVERALEKLRTQLGRRGVTSTSAALATVLGAHASAAAPGGMATHVAGLIAGGGMSELTSAAVGAAIIPAKWAAAALGTVVLFAGGFAVHEILTLRASEAELANLEQAHARLLERVSERGRQAAAAERELKAATDARRRLPATSAAKAAAFPSAAVNAAPDAEPRNAIVEADALMARYPEIKRTLVGWHAAKVRFQYAPLFASLGLTAEQVDRFVELVRGENLFGDFGANGQFVEFWTHRDPEMEVTRDQRLLDLLGEKGLHAYREFDQRIYGREGAAQLASQLSLTDTPLTPAQANKLVPLLMSVRGPSRYSDGNWDEVLARASVDLMPAQLDVLRDIFESERKSAATREMQRAALETGGDRR